jgi:hypothetical protein
MRDFPTATLTRIDQSIAVVAQNRFENANHLSTAGRAPFNRQVLVTIPAQRRVRDDASPGLAAFQKIREAGGGRSLLSCIGSDDRRISAPTGEQAGVRNPG